MRLQSLCELVFPFFFFFFVPLKAHLSNISLLSQGLDLREMPEVNYRQALLGVYVISRDALSALFYSGQYGGRS